MTACPRHGEKGVKHIGLQVDDFGAVFVLHWCNGGGGFQRAHRWKEPARDEDAVLAKVGLQRAPGWKPNYSYGHGHQGYDHPKWKKPAGNPAESGTCQHGSPRHLCPTCNIQDGAAR